MIGRTLFSVRLEIKDSMRQTLLAVMMLAVAAQTGTAWAFADDEARTAILELREQLKASQRAQVDLMGQVEALRAENQRMIGQMQELTRQVETMDKRLVEVEPARVELNGRVISVKPAERRTWPMWTTGAQVPTTRSTISRARSR